MSTIMRRLRRELEKLRNERAMTHEEREKIITRIWMLAGVTGRTDITWESMAEMTDAEVAEIGKQIDGHAVGQIFRDVENDLKKA
jgi:hypothetical protein